MNINCKLSHARIQRIREQGYLTQNDEEIRSLSIGNRFAYQLCTSLLIVAVVFKIVPLVFFLSIVALLTVILPFHPFDVIYNLGIAKLLARPKLPNRAPQLKFACGIASAWLGMIGFLYLNELILAGDITAVAFIGVAGLLSITDICIPSIIYNAIFKVNINTKLS